MSMSRGAGAGAGSSPEQFWDLPGTFLFTVYVMTTLGFGAPVPQTLWGRSAALIYALMAVPTHFYLLFNASAWVVAKCLSTRNNNIFVEDATMNRKQDSESQNCIRNSVKPKSKEYGNTRKKIMRCICIVSACRCVPVAATLYFAFGVVCFGALRGRTALESITFPLEFTTTGGLKYVGGYVRILYGVYVEGAVFLFACAVASVRRRSAAALHSLAHRYRLFHVDI